MQLRELKEEVIEESNFFESEKNVKNKSPYVLVISWGGTKGLYACWILKAIEEINKNI